MKILLVACLVAVCSAAPPVPNIPQVFCGSGEYFIRSEGTQFGKCKTRYSIIPSRSILAACVLHRLLSEIAVSFTSSLLFHSIVNQSFHSFTVLMCFDYVNQMEVGINMNEQVNLTTESLLRYDPKTSHIITYIITGYAIVRISVSLHVCIQWS